MHYLSVRRRMATESIRGAFGKFIGSMQGSMESIRRKQRCVFSTCDEFRDRRREKKKSRRVHRLRSRDGPDQNVSRRVKHSHLKTTSHCSHSTSIVLIPSLLTHTAKIQRPMGQTNSPSMWPSERRQSPINHRQNDISSWCRL